MSAFERIQFHFVWGMGRFLFPAIIVLAAFSLALYRPPQEDAMFWSPDGADVHGLLR
jgi:hypothetical protein